jgi:hypothetical protein
MVAIVVILVGVVGIFVFEDMGGITDPAPNVAQATGEFVPGASDQRVRIIHRGGDNVPAEDIEIIVRASGPDVDTEARLDNLPDFNEKKDPENIISFFHRGIKSDNENVWAAGDTIYFEINVGSGSDGADFREPPTSRDADELQVIIVHSPSDQIIFDETFRP